MTLAKMAKRAASPGKKQRKVREKRIRVALPVRFTSVASGESQHACTLNITKDGARIAGLKLVPEVDELVEVTRGTKKEIFRVVWAGEPGTRDEGQAGIVKQKKGHGKIIWEATALKPVKTEAPPELPKSKLPPEPEPGVLYVPRKQLIGIGVGLAVLVSLTLFLLLRTPPPKKPAPRKLVSVAGVNATIASQINDAQKWRLADAGDFDADSFAWVRDRGQTVSTRIVLGSVSGRDESGYVLAPIEGSNTPQARRIVLFADRQIRFDKTFARVASIALVPRANIAGVNWQGQLRAPEATTDGLLVIQEQRDPQSSVLLFVSGVRIVTLPPADFHAVPLH